ncbi:hypothetical protein FACS1894208_06960 [Clostridia bacterium]|nr:hypothetical protein FACS1894208_06960 [Clostridia bacterium]
MTGWAYIYSLRAYDERESSFNESLEGIAGRVALVNGRNVEISTTDLQGVMVTITFNKKLSLAETWTLIETYHIDTKHMDIVGSATSPALSFSARGETPEGIMSSVSANTNMFKSKFEAFLSMTARIDSKYLGALQRDSNVFLVDPSGDGYFRGHKSISSHERNDIIHSDYPYPRPMTDALEGLNMLR